MTIQIAREETRCHHMGYSFLLTARALLYAPSHRQDSTYHSLCYTSRGALAGTIPGLRRYCPQKPLSIVCVRLVLKLGDLSEAILLLNNSSGVKNILSVERCTVENSYLFRWISGRSEQMDIPESINVIINIMPLIVFFNMIIFVVVVSWCGQGFTMMWLQYEENITNTDQFDILWLIHILWHTSALTHQVQNGVTYS